MSKIIEVKETIRDKYSLFNIKRFKFGNLSIERPTRVIDSKNIRYKHIFSLFEDRPIIFEKSIFVNLKRFCKVVNALGSKKVADHFGVPSFEKDYPRYISVTLTFNPIRDFKSQKTAKDYLEGYLFYYKHYSTSVLLVPNIKIYRYIKQGNRVSKEVVATADEFINLIDIMYDILDYRDNKPIFVPLSLRFSMNDISKLAKHYIKREYYNVWIDFEGGAVTEDRIARIHKFMRVFDELGLFDKLVVIATNVRREIISNIKKDYTPASDALASLIGANIIGVNREPLRPVEGQLVIERSKLREHKARIFDHTRYYYFKAIIADWLDQEIRLKVLNDVKTNVAFNIRLVDEEFCRQADSLLEKGSVKDHIYNKQMLQEYKQGSLIKALLNIERGTSKITEWF